MALEAQRPQDPGAGPCPRLALASIVRDMSTEPTSQTVSGESDPLKQHIFELRADRDQAKDREKREAWTKSAGVSVVFVAVLAAIATQWGGKYSTRTLTALNDATYYQARASDQWSFYQAKSIKQNLYEVAREQQQPRPSDAVPDDFSSKVARFEQEKAAIKREAERLEVERQHARDAANVWSARGSAMGLAVSVYQIAIAVASIAMLMKRKAFWYTALVLALAAAGQMLRAWSM
jgi:hypothetical protein